MRMASTLLKKLSDNKTLIEDFMEVFEKGAEALAEIVGEVFPVFSIAAPLVQLAMENVESKEMQFMKEQFQKVRNRLDVVSEEVERINQEIKKSGADAAYFQVEENLINQFRKYMDILNAKPEVRKVKKKLFLDHFSKTGGDKNLHSLYNAVTGDNFSGESVLEITLNYEEKSRRAMEDFCAQLKNLFCVGLIALVGHAALKDSGEEEEILQDWAEKCNDVERRMKKVVDECRVNFAGQAEVDVGKRLKEWSRQDQQELADMVLKFLMQKYNWVSWSVRVFAHSWATCWCPRGGRRHHGISGQNYFTFETEPCVWVSYSEQPVHLNKEDITNVIETQKKRRDKMKLAKNLHTYLPNCLVHVVDRKVAEGSSFPDSARYHQKHGGDHIYIYSE